MLVPSKPTVSRLPRGPMLTMAPGTPALTLTPLRLKFTLTPGKRRTERRDLNPMKRPFRCHDQADAAAGLESRGVSGALGWLCRRLLFFQVLPDQITARPDDVSRDDVTHTVLRDLPDQ